MDAMPSPRIILFSSAAFFARPLSQTFRLLADTGYEGAEVMVTKDPASQDPVRIRELAAEHGLTVGASTRRACSSREGCGDGPDRQVERTIEVAAEAEIPTWSSTRRTAGNDRSAAGWRIGSPTSWRRPA